MSSVDVIVPCYKYGHYLPQCIKSIVDQPEVDVRILIIDDASPDNSGEVAASLAGSDSRIEYRQHAYNQGHIDTYNEGIEWLRSDYMLLISADDSLAPGALSRSAQILDTHPTIGLTFGKEVTFTRIPPNTNAQQFTERNWEFIKGLDFIENLCRTSGNPVSTPSAIVRTSIQKAVGGYKHTLPHSGDMEMWLRVAARADVAFIQSVQAFKRVHQSNMTHKHNAPHIGDFAERIEAFRSFFFECEHLLPDGARLRELAYRELGIKAMWAASSAFDHRDRPACDNMLEMALKLHPDIVNERNWKRLHWKLRLGPKLWSILFPASTLVKRLRSPRS
jgi:glycosyltransferase involved in cell wall biosynthesis